MRRRAILAGLAGGLAIRALPAQARSATLAWPTAAPSRPAHAPKQSDVCFSSRWPRPRDHRDPHDTLAAGRAFHANRLDWCYTTDRAFVARAKASGLGTVGGTVNASLPDTPGGREYSLGRATLQDGTLMAGRFWANMRPGCASSPDYRHIWLAHATAALEAGADHLQMDDPRLNAELVRQGGCRCPHCAALARGERLSLDRDAVRVARVAVDRFYEDVFARLERRAGRAVTVSCNNSRGRTGWPFDKFGFGMAEIHSDTLTPTWLAEFLQRGEQAGRPQVCTLVANDMAATRSAIAWSYACGGHMIVPWDVWPGAGQPDGQRFFAAPADCADLYGFARRLESVLDGAAQVAMFSPADAPLSVGRATPWVSVRADPRRRFMAIHLVRWEQGEAGVLRLDAALLPPGLAATGRLVEPDGGETPLERTARGELTARVAAAPWSVLLFGGA